MFAEWLLGGFGILGVASSIVSGVGVFSFHFISISLIGPNLETNNIIFSFEYVFLHLMQC